jgi:hypothetical protein
MGIKGKRVTKAEESKMVRCLRRALRHAVRYSRAAYVVRQADGRITVTVYCPRKGRLLAAIGRTTDLEVVVVRHP